METAPPARIDVASVLVPEGEHAIAESTFHTAFAG
jgi:hypothetical protein